jgi:hypothetical protein
MGVGAGLVRGDPQECGRAFDDVEDQQLVWVGSLLLRGRATRRRLTWHPPRLELSLPER